MILTKKTTGSPVLLLIVLAIALMFTGCASGNSDSQIRSLEDDVASLKKTVSSLEGSLDDMQKENTVFKTKIQSLEEQVNSLKISSR